MEVEVNKRLKSSILTKLLSGTVLVVLIPFVIANTYAYRMNYTEALHKTVEENRGLLGVGLDSLEEYFERLNEIPLNVYENATYYRILQKKESFTAQEQYNLRQMLETMVGQDTSIRRAEIICKNGEVITQEEIGGDNEKAWRNAWYKNSEANIQSGYGENGEISVLKYSTTLKDMPTSETLVQMNFYCVLDHLESIGQKVGADENAGIIVAISMNESDMPIYKNAIIENVEYQQYGNGYSVGELDGVAGFFFIGSSNYSGEELRIMKFVPQSIIVAPITQMIEKTVLLQGVILIFVTIFIIYIYKNMVRPIKNIVHNIDKVREGKYEYKASYATVDEIGELDHKYEEMVETINVLINKEFKNALEISKGRLKMLQAQINPHFLNNMLQTISTQALKAGDRGASDSIAKLARIFQYNMDTSTEYVPLRNELKQISMYLELQQSRFRERLEFTIACEEQLQEIIVPKMIIQPLVENSLNHGVAKIEGTAKISIRIYQQEEIIIEIIDNGQGVSEEKIQRLKDDFKNYEITPEAGHGIGLVNVLQRLEIYSSEFTWDIESEQNVETKITLRFLVHEEVI